MPSIYSLSWDKDSFFYKFWLFVKSNLIEWEAVRWPGISSASAHSSLSSTYYSIAGTGAKKLRSLMRPVWLAPVKLCLWMVSWGPLTAWCYWRMLHHSDEAVTASMGHAFMTPEQCEIRQSILRRRKKYNEAEKCIGVALRMEPDKAHTKGLLHIGLADIFWKRDKTPRFVEEEVWKAVREAEFTEEYDARQASRIYRHCANLLEVCGNRFPHESANFRRKAKLLAESAGAKDQLFKMK